MYAMSPKTYFSKRYWFNAIDFAIVIIGFIGSFIEIVVIYIVCSEGKTEVKIPASWGIARAHVFLFY